MKIGKVISISDHPSKNYGFLTSQNGENYYFQLDDGRTIIPGISDPVFTKTKETRIPKIDDSLVFSIGSNSQGIKACPWGYTNDYERAKKEILARPPPIIIRVLQETKPYSSRRRRQEILWQGTKITELCRKFPKTHNFREDRLFPTTYLEKYIRFLWFEKKRDGAWEVTEDPRPDELKHKNNCKN